MLSSIERDFFFCCFVFMGPCELLRANALSVAAAIVLGLPGTSSQLNGIAAAARRGLSSGDLFKVSQAIADDGRRELLV
jgi:hypothetical protein